MTINDLLELCNEEIKKGNGNKTIFISRDDEGNGFHKLIYGFTSTPENVREYDYDPDKEVLLG